MAKSAVETLVAKIDADISRLRDMREYLLSNTGPETTAAPKTRKARKKKGLPAAEADASI
jgi:hypothetical protein